MIGLFWPNLWIKKAIKQSKMLVINIMLVYMLVFICIKILNSHLILDFRGPGRQKRVEFCYLRTKWLFSQNLFFLTIFLSSLWKMLEIAQKSVQIISRVFRKICRKQIFDIFNFRNFVASAAEPGGKNR